MTTAYRVSVSILALLGLLAVVLGIPVALATLVGWPVPSPLPTVAELGDFVAGRAPIPADYLISLLALAMWGIWFQIAWAAAIEVVATVRGRLADRARLLPGVQLGVAKLVTTATLLITSSISLKPAAAGSLVPVAVEQLADARLVPAPQHRASNQAGPADGVGAGSTVARSTASLVGMTASTQTEQVSVTAYMTEPGDTWWGIAEDHLGSGTRWKELRSLNLGRVMADGSAISANTDLLKPEWRLLLPADAVSSAAASSVAGVDRVVVKPGDTLWGIAEDHLDQRTPSVVVEHVADIAELNHDVINGNPDLIFPGQELDLPPRPGETVDRADGPGSDAGSESAADEAAGSGGGTTTETDSTHGAGTTSADDADTTSSATTWPVPTVPETTADPGDPADQSTEAPATTATSTPSTPAPSTTTPATTAEVPPPTEAATTTSTATTATSAEVTTPSTEAPATPTTAITAEGERSVETSEQSDGVSLAGVSAESPGRSPGREIGSAPGETGPTDSSADDLPESGANPGDANESLADESSADENSAGEGVTDSTPSSSDRERVDLLVNSDGNLDFDSEGDDGVLTPFDPQAGDGSIPAGGEESGERLTESELLASQSPGQIDGLDSDGSRAPVFVGLAALTLIGGSLYRARGRRRAAALRHRHAGRRPEPPKRRTRGVARRLAAAAEPEHTEFVNIGLRALSRQLQSVRPKQLPKISGVWVSHDRLVIALADDSPRSAAPPPFTEFADGSGWSLHRSRFDEAKDVARGANGPLPLLTTIGTTTALDLALTTNSRAPAEAYGLASSLLFAVDIEAGRVVSVQAQDEASTVEALTMMALELATAETADQVEVVCVGFGHRLATFDRVTVIEDLTDVLADLENVTSRAVYAAADASPFATRVGNGAADTWNPVVVFHPDAYDPHSQNLIELAGRAPGGVTAVCGFPTQQGWTLTIRGDRISCPDLPGDLANHEFKRPELEGVELIPDLFDEPWEEVDLDDDFWKPMDPVEEAHTWHLLDSEETNWRPMRPVTEQEGDEVGPRPAGVGPAGRHGSDRQDEGEKSDQQNDPDRSLAVVVNRAEVEPTQDPEELWDSLVTGDPDSWPDAGVPDLDELQHSVEHRPLQEVEENSLDEEIDRLFLRDPSGRESDPFDPDADPDSDDDFANDEPRSRHLRVVDSARSDDPSEPGGPTDTRPEEAVRISVLGGFTIGEHHVGDRTKPWKYSKTPELILYLLLHPGGASQDLLMEQLFPEQPPNRPRLNQLVSDARTKALGQNDSGEFLLPHASPTEPFYKLLPSVGLDLRDFARHCSAARRSDDIDVQKQEWKAALELVNGRPFTLPHDGYEWAIPEIEATVIKVEEAAVALTDIAFELEDYQLAVWATKRGLLTGTGYYDLLVKRGRAALLLQDPEEIVRAFADLQVSLDYTGAPEEGMPDLSSHPDLEQVYNELSTEGRSKDRPQ